MDTQKDSKICPVEKAGLLDFSLRKLFQNPKKIFRPFVQKGMAVLDAGCGPGFFTIELAKLVGDSGKVIAADLQDGMLNKLKMKIEKSHMDKIVTLHKCHADCIGVSERVDFINIFYMFHEVPDQLHFINELKKLLKLNGRIFISEPKFHVTKNDFMKSVDMMKQNGFEVIEMPKVFFSRTVLLQLR